MFLYEKAGVILMKIGFIGSGNMAQAMIGGILKAGLVDKADLIGSAASEKTIAAVANKFGIKTTKNNKEVAEFSDILILAVKPNKYGEVIE
jgi:pyrroline-5-carboxylate reductase